VKLKTTGEVVRVMGMSKSPFVAERKVTVRNLKRETFDVPFTETTGTIDDEFLNFCKKWPECDWDYPN
jgi:hypothetical protein